MFKIINYNDINVISNVYNKTFNISDNSEDLYNINKQYGTTGSWSSNGPTNSDGTYKTLIYDSIKTIYYNSRQSMIDYEHYNFVTKSLSSDVLVYNIPQNIIGLKIKPKSVEITSGSLTIIDDGHYNLFYNTTHVGNVFYDTGHIIITNTNYMSLFDEYTLSYKSSEMITEYSILCNVNSNEFNYTLNNTAFSGSVYMNEFQTSELLPYITTIGLYNNDNELLAVGKFPKPIKRYDIDLAFLLKFDI
ncbi:MAG TPA: hypothetical protein PLY35_09035 [Thermotogota bacterium]|nr:hypothetical protein [Thermotogota bacterium]